MAACPVLHNSPTLPLAGLPIAGFPLWGWGGVVELPRAAAGLEVPLGASAGTDPGTAVQPSILTERSRGK